MKMALRGCKSALSAASPTIRARRGTPSRRSQSTSAQAAAEAAVLTPAQREEE
jgi:hypothetical protein